MLDVCCLMVVVVDFIIITIIFPGRKVWASGQPALPQASSDCSSAHAGKSTPGDRHSSIPVGLFFC